MTETAATPDQPDTAARLTDRARTCRAQGRYAEARPLAERALAVTEAALGPGHPETALRRNILAALCRFLDETAGAAAPERRLRAGRR
ncbi:MAG TPA: tetratricopeptide repeat protein [Trebonia sp.]